MAYQERMTPVWPPLASLGPFVPGRGDEATKFDDLVRGRLTRAAEDAARA